MQRLGNREDVGVVGRVAATRRDLVAVRPAGSGAAGACRWCSRARCRVAGRGHDTPLPHLPSEAGSRLRCFSGCVVRPSIGSAEKVPTRAPAATRCACSGKPTPTKRRVPPPTRRRRWRTAQRRHRQRQQCPCREWARFQRRHWAISVRLTRWPFGGKAVLSR